MSETGLSCPCESDWVCCSATQTCAPDRAACPLPVALEPEAPRAFTVPMGHPRLWFADSASLDAARSAFKKRYPLGVGFEPRTEPVANAFGYLMTQDANFAAVATSWLLALTLPDSDVPGPNGGGYDGFANSGRAAALVFDWCYDQFTPAQRATLITRWNGYVAHQFQRTLGGPTTPATTESWVVFSTGLSWALASMHHSDQAEALLTQSWARFDEAYKPFLADGAQGGVLGQGSHADPLSLEAMALPFATLKAWGRQPLNESLFFREAVYALAFSTTPGPTAATSSRPAGDELFPSNDDDYWQYGRSASSKELGAYLVCASRQWPAEPVGDVARALLARLAPPVETYVAFGEDAGFTDAGSSAALTRLPHDHWAAGIGQVFSRDGWSPNASALVFQVGLSRGGYAGHRDVGSFEVWADGRWVTRESPGRAGTVAGLGGQGAEPHLSALPHNVVLFEGVGPASPSAVDGAPRVLRLQVADGLLYAAVDLSPAYRASASTRVEGGRLTEDNAHAGSVVREVFFVKPLSALVVVDRLESVAFARRDVEAAAQVTLSPHVDDAAAVRKTELLHFEERPVLSQVNGWPVAQVTGPLGLTTATFVRPQMQLAVVDERDGGSLPTAQWRLEATTSEQVHTLSIQVLEWRPVNVAAPLTLALSEGDGGVALELGRAGQKARVELVDGPTVGPTRFGFADGGVVTPVELRTEPQREYLTADGPFWVP